MAERFKTILLFGRPGAGKGTQGVVLGTLPGFYHCACGDVFRQLDSHSELGRIFVEHSSRGELVPDDVTVRIWSSHIHSTVSTGRFKPKIDLLVLDGIPRNRHQAEILEEHVEVLKLIHLVCHDDAKMIQRLRRRALKENRMDDTKEEIIRNRWRVYEQETAPVLEYYSDHRVAEVNAMTSPAQVLHDILEIVIPIQNKHFAQAMQ